MLEAKAATDRNIEVAAFGRRGQQFGINSLRDIKILIEVAGAELYLKKRLVRKVANGCQSRGSKGYPLHHSHLFHYLPPARAGS